MQKEKGRALKPPHPSSFAGLKIMAGQQSMVWEKIVKSN